MAARKTYSEKLRDPRWQRMRLEVMSRDGFKCVACSSGEHTLNVHHGYYRRGADPWEYPLESLHTLCEECHSFYESVKERAHEALARLHWTEQEEAIGFIEGRRFFDLPRAADDRLYLSSDDFYIGACRAVGIRDHDYAQSLIKTDPDGRQYVEAMEFDEAQAREYRRLFRGEDLDGRT